MLTLFAHPKVFKGHFGVIQRNAISQWVRLRPTPEIILFGNEEGTLEIAQELSLRQVSEVKRNEYGTPLLSDLFAQAHALASYDILCYANADMMLLGDFMGAVQRVAAWRDRFLMVGRRTNVELDEPAIYDSSEREARLRDLVSQRGQLVGPSAIDYFVFPRGLFPMFPPFAIGRPVWDNWFLWKARNSKMALVDASEVVLAVHQNHDYSHHPRGRHGVSYDEEAKENRRMAGRGFCTIGNATHKLTLNGIESCPYFTLKRQAVRTWWSQLLMITGPLRRSLGLRKEKIASVMGKLGLSSSRQ